VTDTPPAGLSTGAGSSVWDGVVGQKRAVHQLSIAALNPVHAYLFVGPAGSTKHEAARAFAALLLTNGIDDPANRASRLALAGEHPDVREVERTGARISAEQVADIIRTAALAPVEGDRKVMLLHEFNLLDANGAARLLKTLEEPPASTVFVVLADQVPPELVTIASRCVRIEFAAIHPDLVAATLVTEGVPVAAARNASAASAGNITRARVLAVDPNLMARRDAFAGFPHRLDGSGHTVVSLCTEALALIETAAAPLAERQATEMADLEARVTAAGERGSGRKPLEERHKREQRRHRVDELRSGLSIMAGVYRDVLIAGTMTRPDAPAVAVQRIHISLEALERNPNETLLLQSLLLDLPALG
jgi:DNA polymerase-3 subunit delta'